ncbi:MAG: hypothetical protein PHE33_12530 [Bacteroidales bacterium]|nr:hypothetical protein [Bacteroidales bacterium]
MTLKINNSGQNIEDILQKLKEQYPNLKIKKTNKTTIIIPKGKISSVVRIKKNQITVNGDINMRHTLNFLLLILGILIGIVGVIFIFPILWIVYAKRMKKFKNEVYNVLS